jgi:hypothetical protein
VIQRDWNNGLVNGPGEATEVLNDAITEHEVTEAIKHLKKGIHKVLSSSQMYSRFWSIVHHPGRLRS